jgi:hypothetical protein
MTPVGVQGPLLNLTALNPDHTQSDPIAVSDLNASSDPCGQTAHQGDVQNKGDGCHQLGWVLGVNR